MVVILMIHLLVCYSSKTHDNLLGGVLIVYVCSLVIV